MKNQRGFSFIEMIVVLSIMAVVAGTLVPVGVQVLERERARVTEENLLKIDEALRAYYFEYKDWPRDSGTTEIKLVGLITNIAGHTAANWKGPFISYSGPASDTDTDNIVVYDRWRRRYAINLPYAAATQTNIMITSNGSNPSDASDDITRTVYVGDIASSIKGQKTLAEINAINAAFTCYTANIQGKNQVAPLPAGIAPSLIQSPARTLTSALALMRSYRLLPPAPASPTPDPFLTDEWGTTYSFTGNLVRSASLP